MTRKDEIETYVEKQTSLKIIDKSFNFEACNAYIISLDLDINRSNVSRILNQLHQENKLIKVEGRPTLFLSKKAIYNNLNVNADRLPSLISKKDDIKNYIGGESHASIVLRNKPDIIGIDKGGSLSSIYNQLAPYFINPPTNLPLLFVLNGEQGTGRENFVIEMFNFYRSNQKKEQSVLLCDIYDDSSSIERALDAIDPDKHPVISFMFSISLEDYAPLLYRIKEKYIHHDMPIIFFIGSNQFQYTGKMPFEVYLFPSLADRPASERLTLILYLFLKQAQQIQKELRIPKEVLNILMEQKFEFNCIGLAQAIYEFVSNCYYNLQKADENFLVLDKRYLPTQIYSANSKSDTLDEFLPTASNVIIIRPSMHLIDITSMIQFTQKELFLPIPNDIDTYMDQLIYNCTSSFNEWKDSDSGKETVLIERLSDTFLCSDPQLIYLLNRILLEFIDNRISILKYKTKQPLKISDTTKNIYNGLIRTIKYRFRDIPFMEVEKYILQQLIEHCVKATRKVKIPVLIIAHENNIAQNYAHAINASKKTRMFFSIDYTKSWQNQPLEDFIKHLIPVIQTLNRGKGVTLLVDHEPLDRLESRLILNSKIPIFSFSKLSYPLVQTIYESNQNETVSIIKGIVMRTDTMHSTMMDDNLIIKAERNNSIPLTTMKDYFPYLNTSKANEALYHSLVMISEKLEFKLNNHIIIDYLFHGNCILNNILFKHRDYDIPELYDYEILRMMKEALGEQPLFATIKFKNEELNVLYNSLYNNIFLS